MGAGIFMSPAAEQLSTLIINEHIVFCFIRQQDDAAQFVLHHLMTIFYRVLRRIYLAPVGIDAVAFVVVTENRFRCRTT